MYIMNIYTLYIYIYIYIRLNSEDNADCTLVAMRYAYKADQTLTAVLYTDHSSVA